MTSWTDVTVQARIKIISFTGASSSYVAGLAVRMTDATHYYYVALRSDTKLSIKIDNSGNTTLGGSVNANIATGTWYTVKFTAVSGTLTATVTDPTNVTVTDQVTDTTLTVGGIGLVVVNATAEFDDVVVTKP